MGRAPCCDKANVKKGPWSPEEDAKLKAYIDQHGTGGNWIALPQKIGLKRCGKSCRLRWLNYLRPNLRHGSFSEEEDNIICSLYINIGSRWSIIAAQLPGRTDNDIKNYWNTRLKKKLLGKQRKEARRSAKHQHHQDDQAVKMIATVDHHDHEGFMAHPSMMMMMMNPAEAPYWPHLPPPVDDQECPQDLIKNLLSKLGGRYSEEPNTPHLENLHQYTPIDHLYGNMVSCADQFPNQRFDHGNEYMIQQIESNPIELSDLVYGDEPLQLVDNATFYGVNDMINVSATSSTSESSSNWGNDGMIPILEFPSMSYEANCQLQQEQENSIFQDPSYFGLR